MKNFQNQKKTEKYIAELQMKDIPPEWRNCTAINQVTNDLTVFKPSYDNLPTYQNNAVSEVYDNEDAGWKTKQEKYQTNKLKRKSSISQDQVASKKPISQISDTFSNNEDSTKMEYCNVPSNFITVSSRNCEHTLRPKNTVNMWSCVASSTNNSKSFDLTKEEVVSAGSDDCGSTDIPVIPLVPVGGQGVGGNGDDSDDDTFSKSQPEDNVPKPKYSETDYENQLKLFNVLLSKLENWCVGKKKTLGDNLDHVYNECQKINMNKPNCNSNSENCQQIKDYFDNVVRNMATENTDTSRQVQAEAVMSAVYLCHSMQCKLGESCRFSLCKDIVASVREEIELSVEKCTEYSFVTNNAPVVLYSNTPEFYVNTQIQLEQLQFNFECEVGKGAFGKVTNAWVCANKCEAHMAIKKMFDNKKHESPDIDEIVKNLKQIDKSPFLLTPDLILSTADRKLTYMVMERGEVSLSGYLKKVFAVHTSVCTQNDHLGPCNAGLVVETCILFFKQIIEGIHHLHQRELVHADIKSDNVMIMPGYNQVKIIDFDMIKMEATKKQCGTPGYISPEIVQRDKGNCIKASDVFAASHILAEMYFGGLGMGYGKIVDVPQYIQFLWGRRELIRKFLDINEPVLGQLFKAGSEFDPAKRVSTATLLRCFRDNKTVRHMYLANICIPAVSELKVADNKDFDKQHALNPHQKLAKKIVKNWIEGEKNKLPPRLPVAENVGLLSPTMQLFAASRSNGDNSSEEFNEDIDIPLDTILKI